MAKKTHKRQKTIPYGNKKYVGTMQNGSITVRSNETAQGQTIVKATLNKKTGQWDIHGDGIPESVKKEFETLLT